MKIELKDFQDVAVEQLFKKLDLARYDVQKNGNRQAVILAAPTGSGKTVITAEIKQKEQIIQVDTSVFIGAN